MREPKSQMLGAMVPPYAVKCDNSNQLWPFQRIFFSLQVEMLHIMIWFWFQILQVVEGLANKDISQIAAHPEGRHYLALTADGEVYSWGNGDGGQLGHGDTRFVLASFYSSCTCCTCRLLLF